MSQFLENLINSLTIIVAIIALCFWIVVLMTLYLFFRQVKISEMERISTKDPTMMTNSETIGDVTPEIIFTRESSREEKEWFEESRRHSENGLFP